MNLVASTTWAFPCTEFDKPHLFRGTKILGALFFRSEVRARTIPGMKTSVKAFNLPFLLILASTLLGCGEDEEAADPPSGTTLPSFRDPRCDRWGQIELLGQYMVQNNIWNEEAAAQEQCVTALWDGESSIAGMIVDPVDIETSDTPASYPAIVYGWHWGTFYGAYAEARRVEDIDTIPSTWRFSVPSEARYNASYDLWLHALPAPPDANGSLELMVWVDSHDASPIGEMVDLVELEGASWEVWRGQNTDFGFATVTYRRTEGTTDVTLDLLGFVQGALDVVEAPEDWYLLGVEAGFELWRATDRFASQSYEVRID